MPYRVLALALAVVLLVTFAAPAKAEALEPLTIIAIAGVAVLVLVLVVYLVIANVEGPKLERSARAPMPPVAVALTPAPPHVLMAVQVPRDSP